VGECRVQVVYLMVYHAWAGNQPCQPGSSSSISTSSTQPRGNAPFYMHSFEVNKMFTVA
jgi:hypothetical protein